MISNRGEFKNPKKSAFNLEKYDSSWEKDYMKELEKDDKIKKWTKNHGLKIDYMNDQGKLSYYFPDFLVELKNGKKEIIEIKGKHLMKTKDTMNKIDAGRKWCNDRGMNFRLISRY